jgi:hypothetical protein
MKPGEWVGFIDISDHVDVDVDLLSRFLERLVSWGVLERHELYFGPHTSPDRLTHPPMKPPKYKEYWGFEWGYRIKSKECHASGDAN